MRQALELAERGRGRTTPNPPVGAIVVREGTVVGRGFHPRAGEPHAEIFALREAGRLARDAEVFVTLEPCSHHGRTGPCADALIAAGVRRVVVGVQDPNPQVAGKGLDRLRAAGIAVEVGVLQAECQRLIRPFATWVLHRRPYTLYKAAMTLDGCTATGLGDSRWVSCEESRQEVHRLRDRVDAILVGVETALADDPQLTTRLPEGGGRDPMRIVVDSRLRLPVAARMLQQDSAALTIIATTEAADPRREEELTAAGAHVWRLPSAHGRVDLAALWRRLGDWPVQTLLVEGGGTLAAAALAQGLIDHLLLFISPRLVGGEGRRLFAGPGVGRMAESLRLDDLCVRQCGEDMRVEGEIRPCSPD